MIQLSKCEVLEAVKGLFPENVVKSVRPVLVSSGNVKQDKNICYFGNVNGRLNAVFLYGGVVVEPSGNILFNQFTGSFVMFAGYEITLQRSIPEIDIVNEMPDVPVFDKNCCTDTAESVSQLQDITVYHTASEPIFVDRILVSNYDAPQTHQQIDYDNSGQLATNSYSQVISDIDPQTQYEVTLTFSDGSTKSGIFSIDADGNDWFIIDSGGGGQVGLA